MQTELNNYSQNFEVFLHDKSVSPKKVLESFLLGQNCCATKFTPIIIEQPTVLIDFVLQIIYVLLESPKKSFHKFTKSLPIR